MVLAFDLNAAAVMPDACAVVVVAAKAGCAEVEEEVEAVDGNEADESRGTATKKVVRMNSARSWTRKKSESVGEDSEDEERGSHKRRNFKALDSGDTFTKFFRERGHSYEWDNENANDESDDSDDREALAAAKAGYGYGDLRKTYIHGVAIGNRKHVKSR